MEPTGVAVMDWVIVWQKNRALPSPKGVRDGRKLKLQALAIALAVASRLKGDSTQSRMIALAQTLSELVSGGRHWVTTRRVSAWFDHGC